MRKATASWTSRRDIRPELLILLQQQNCFETEEFDKVIKCLGIMFEA